MVVVTQCFGSGVQIFGSGDPSFGCGDQFFDCSDLVLGCYDKNCTSHKKEREKMVADLSVKEQKYLVPRIKLYSP